jgi:signal transduction histidine kinase/ligand-binding sensor domain-containing protein
MRTPRAILSLLLLPLVLVSARAGQLPVRNYTTADGLAHERVRCIVRDSHGFLWFCTGDGISRFDGYGFNSYGAAEGLAQPAVNQLAEGRGGVYWLATAGGVVLFDPSAGRGRSSAETRPPTPVVPEAGKSRFTYFRVGDDEVSNRVQSILADHTGRVWAGTQSGLYFADESADGRRVFRRLDLHATPDAYIFSLLEDAEGSVWVAGSTGLFRHTPDGRVLAYAVAPGRVTSLGADREGRLWVGFGNGFAVVRPEPLAALAAPAPWRVKSTREETHWPDGRLRLPEAEGEACVYGADDGLTKNGVWAVRQTGDGRVWILTRYAGLLIFDGGRLRRYTTEQGLVDNILNAVEEDAAGNVWLGTEAYGALKIARHGFESFSKTDGIGRTYVRGVVETKAGELVAVTRTPDMFRLEGDRFARIRLNLPEGTPHLRHHGNEFPIQDHAGEWWVMTGAGLYRFPAVARVDELATARPSALYTERDGLAGHDLTAIFEDSRGDLWIGTEGRAAVTRWERSTGEFHTYAEADGVPAAGSPTAFEEDRAGNIWVGFREHGLVRCDAATGRCTRFAADEGVPPGVVRSIHLDASGRLWAPTSLSGVVLVEDPTAPRPAFRIYSTAQGLSSVNTRSVVEDELGRLYFATVRGVDRLDERTGQVRHFTTADGLCYSEVGPSLRDSSGALWFTTYSGLSRYFPDRDEPQPPSPTLVRGLAVAGVPYTVSELGESEVSGLVLGPEQGQVQIDFFSLSFAPGETLRYQHRLEGQDADWSAPSEQRSVSLRLAPGSYRFAVRAVGADGVPGPRPAFVSFRILPPVWRRWWFVALCALAFGAAAFAVRRHFAARRRERERAEADLRRAKEERLAELERVRKRIATDLHDDIGSSLTQIAVLSEVARQRAGAGAEQLAQISAVSNELVESMSDIVWAINPKKDRLSDLTQRMRRFASDLFTARGVRFHLDAPVASAADGGVRLGADLRREVFLIFKESVNNVVKHSGASRAEVEFRLEGGELLLRVTDDGRGFDAGGADRSGEYERTAGGTGGNGLGSLFRRARELGGVYEVRSAPGAGTTVSLRVPVGRPRAGNGDGHHPNGR